MCLGMVEDNETSNCVPRSLLECNYSAGHGGGDYSHVKLMIWLEDHIITDRSNFRRQKRTDGM